MDDEDIGILLLAIYASAKLQQKKEKKPNNMGETLSYEERNKQHILLNDFRLRDINEYRCTPGTPGTRCDTRL